MGCGSMFISYALATGISNEYTEVDIIQARAVSLIMELTKYEGKIIQDTSKPDGQPRRCLEISEAKKEFDFEAKIDLKEGLKKRLNGIS